MPAAYRILAASALFSFLIVSGCRAGLKPARDKGFVLSADMPLPSYVKSAVGANGRRQTRLFFPLLQVYDTSGALVYISHNANENAELLKTLPDGITNRGPIPDTATLLQVVRNTPGFQAKEELLKHARKATVLSVVLEDCHACSVQEEALDTAQKHLVDRGVTLLLLHVDKPTWGVQQ